jgi:hypothetical protein
VFLTNGDWYLAVVNISGSNVTYSVLATNLTTLLPPLFLFPTNTDVFTNIETTLFTTNCVATDSNLPPLPLTYTLVSGPTNMIITNGVISWTPDEAQGPSTNAVAVSVSNGAFSITNSFTIIVEESNTAPFWPTNVPSQTNYIINARSTLAVMNTATDTDIPVNPLTYTLSVSPLATNAVIDTNGIITWMPAPAQAGSNYLFTTIVTDTNPWAINAKSLSATNSFTVTVLGLLELTNGLPQTNSVGAGGVNWYLVNVPTNALAATNILLFATNLPVNIWFSTNLPPTTINTNDVDLMPDATNGVSVLATNSTPTNIVPGSVYFLGVQNTNNLAVTYGLEVNFLLAAPAGAGTNPVPFSGIVYTNAGGTNAGFLLTWFAPTNDIFEVDWTTSLTPVVNWSPFTPPVTSTDGTFTFTDTNLPLLIKFYRLRLLP